MRFRISQLPGGNHLKSERQSIFPTTGFLTSPAILVSILCFLMIFVQAGSAANLINFDQFNNGDLLSTQIPGLTFTNTIVLTAGISLNELEFPPHSNPNVAGDNGGPISILFTSPVPSFSGYFTYSTALDVSAFARNTPVASATSMFSSNLAISGDPGSTPNELIQISSPSGFTLVTITGAPNGGSFVMDDISFQNVPEPSSWRLLCVAALMLLALPARKRL